MISSSQSLYIVDFIVSGVWDVSREELQCTRRLTICNRWLTRIMPDGILNKHSRSPALERSREMQTDICKRTQSRNVWTMPSWLLASCSYLCTPHTLLSQADRPDGHEHWPSLAWPPSSEVDVFRLSASRHNGADRSGAAGGHLPSKTASMHG